MGSGECIRDRKQRKKKEKERESDKTIQHSLPI